MPCNLSVAIGNKRMLAISTFCGSLAGLRRKRPGFSPAAAAQNDDSRVLQINSDKMMDMSLPSIAAADMDEFMQTSAVDVLAAGAESTEQAAEENLWYAYMEPTTIGPYRNQVRLTCQVKPFSSGSIAVDVIDIQVGSAEDGNSNVVFEKMDTEAFDFRWSNSLTWHQRGSNVRVVHSSTGKIKLSLPWWFPVPDAIVSATFRNSLQYMISDGQSKIAAAIRSKLAKRMQLS